ESPTGVRWTTRPRTQESAPSITGSPVGRRDQPPSANRSMPLVAKRAETSSWWSARKLTVSVRAAETAGHDDDVDASEKASSGGAAETEITDVAVNPTRRPSCSSAITATPAG